MGTTDTVGTCHPTDIRKPKLLDHANCTDLLIILDCKISQGNPVYGHGEIGKLARSGMNYDHYVFIMDWLYLFIEEIHCILAASSSYRIIVKSTQCVIFCDLQSAYLTVFCEMLGHKHLFFMKESL